MESQWYYARQGQRLGPVPSSQLRDLAATGGLAPTDLVWKDGWKDWVEARRVRGLFPQGDELAASESPLRQAAAGGVDSIHSVHQCISSEEARQRLGVAVVNVLLWLMLAILVVVTFFILLIPMALGWLIQWLASEYNVRKLQALGVSVSPAQFPQVAEAIRDACARLGVKRLPRVIVLASGEVNAFAIKFARKRVILILSELLEGLIDQPAELRALLGHEVCHLVLDHGTRGLFELYKPARYRAAREMTCDNAGYAVSGDLGATKSMLKKVCVGTRLHSRLSETALIEEAQEIQSGLIGWLVRRHLNYPPAGARIQNVAAFAQTVSAER